MADAFMLAPLGPLPLAAVGITNAVAVILFAAIYGLLSALSVRVGTARSAGQARRTTALLRNGMALGAIVGVLGAVAMVATWPLLPWWGQPSEVLDIMLPCWLATAASMLPFALLAVFKATLEAVDRPWPGTGFAMLAVVAKLPLNQALIWRIGPVPMLGLTDAGVASLLAETLALAAAVLGLHGQAIARSITQQPQVVDVAATLFFVFACSHVMDGVQSTMTGALRGLSDAGFPAWLSLLAYRALGLPLGWTLAHPAGWGPAGVWTGFVAALVLAAPVLVWRFVKHTHRHSVAARPHKTPGQPAC